MKIGIYGGTFDPVHNGHISVARSVMRDLRLDVVFFVVAADPPHKPDREITPAEVRYKMVETAVEGLAGLRASDVEIKRGGVSYTVDTLRYFKEQYVYADLYLILGEDMLENFPTWRNPEEIMDLATIVAVHRPDFDVDMKNLARRIEIAFDGAVIVTDINGPQISSTQIRNLVYDAKPIEELVPLEVDYFIHEHALYLPDNVRSIVDSLSKELSDYRFKHTLYTAREAVVMADKHGLNTSKARIAALLHDCAKRENYEMVEFALSKGYQPNAEELRNPFLIHARLGAQLAKDEYGIEDKTILNAIRRHTLGAVMMTPFDKVIYLADKLEPTRTYRKLLGIRELSYTDLDTAIVVVMNRTLRYTAEHGGEINRTTQRTLNAIQHRRRDRKRRQRRKEERIRAAQERAAQEQAAQEQAEQEGEVKK